jgi:hypothetical protein
MYQVQQFKCCLQLQNTTLFHLQYNYLQGQTMFYTKSSQIAMVFHYASTKAERDIYIVTKKPYMK